MVLSEQSAGESGHTSGGEFLRLRDGSACPELGFSLCNLGEQGKGSAYLGSATSREGEKYLGVSHVEHTHSYTGCVRRAVQELSGRFNPWQTSRISARTFPGLVLGFHLIPGCA